MVDKKYCAKFDIQCHSAQITHVVKTIYLTLLGVQEIVTGL